MLDRIAKILLIHTHSLFTMVVGIHGAPVAQWLKRWPTDLADRVRFPLVAKSSQIETEFFHCTKPFINNLPSS